MRGWNYGSQWDIDAAIKKVELDSIVDGFDMLAMGRIDGLAGYEINFDYALKQMAQQEGALPEFAKMPSFGGSEEFAAGAKANPKVAKILADFDAGVARIEENGTLDRIREKWSG